MLCVIVASQHHCRMPMLTEHYFKINYVFLKILGLWPYYQHSYLVRLQNVLFIVILIAFIVAQLMVFVTTRYDTSLLLKILSIVFPNIFVTAKYCLFVFQSDHVKRLLEGVQDDWNLLKNKLEIDIIEKYACTAKYLMTYILATCCFGIIMFLILQVLPMILDVVSPLNESRPYQLIIITEYFVNQNKYFYALLTHEMLTGCIGATALCSTITTIMIYIQHACALFKIASYRIENAIEESVLAISCPRREYLLFQRIVHAVNIHQRANEFMESLISEFMTPYIILILIGVGSMSFNLFQFLQLLTLTHDTAQIIIYGLFLITHISYMFVINYAGQLVMDHAAQLFVAAYNGLWYAASLQSQKLVLFIMQKGMKSVALTCAGVFVMSFEGFATLINMVLSYVTVIYSSRS